MPVANHGKELLDDLMESGERIIVDGIDKASAGSIAVKYGIDDTDRDIYIDTPAERPDGVREFLKFTD